MVDLESPKTLPEHCTKEYGCDKKVMDSLALFLYRQDYNPMPDTIQIYNDWIDHGGKAPPGLEGVLNVLEHIRKLSKLEHTELKEALEYDYLV